MTRVAVLGATATLVAAGGAGSVVVFGPDSPWFAIVSAWLPMTALGAASHIVDVTLPEPVHRLRDAELDGRLHERLGVRVVKRLLRRGPATLFNPGLRMPTERTRASLATLETRMRTAEASHLVSFVVTGAVAVHAAARGWWTAAGITAGLDIVLNAYPVLLQRYNRAWLLRTSGPGAERGS